MNLSPEADILLKGLAVTAGIIGTLVAVIYNKLTHTQNDQQEALNEGFDEFTKTKVALMKITTEALAARELLLADIKNTREALQADIKSVRTWVKRLEEELDALEIVNAKELKDLEARRQLDHDLITSLKTSHNNHHKENIQ